MADQYQSNDSRAPASSLNRSEWGSLSIQDRIKAMDSTLNTVEQRNSLGSSSSLEGIASTAEESKVGGEEESTGLGRVQERSPVFQAKPEKEEEASRSIPKRSSVVDIWRKREENAGSTGKQPLVATDQTHREILHDVKTELVHQFSSQSNARSRSTLRGEEEEKKDNEGSYEELRRPYSTLSKTQTSKMNRGVSASPATVKPPELPQNSKTFSASRAPAKKPTGEFEPPVDLTILPAANSSTSTKGANSSNRTSQVASTWARSKANKNVSPRIASLDDDIEEEEEDFFSPDAESPEGFRDKRASVLDFWKARASSNPSASPPADKTHTSPSLPVAKREAAKGKIGAPLMSHDLPAEQSKPAPVGEKRSQSTANTWPRKQRHPLKPITGESGVDLVVVSSETDKTDKFEAATVVRGPQSRTKVTERWANRMDQHLRAQTGEGSLELTPVQEAETLVPDDSEEMIVREERNKVVERWDCRMTTQSRSSDTFNGKVKNETNRSGVKAHSKQNKMADRWNRRENANDNQKHPTNVNAEGHNTTAPKTTVERLSSVPPSDRWKKQEQRPAVLETVRNQRDNVVTCNTRAQSGAVPFDEESERVSSLAGRWEHGMGLTPSQESQASSVRGNSRLPECWMSGKSTSSSAIADTAEKEPRLESYPRKLSETQFPDSTGTVLGRHETPSITSLVAPTKATDSTSSGSLARSHTWSQGEKTESKASGRFYPKKSLEEMTFAKDRNQAIIKIAAPRTSLPTPKSKPKVPGYRTSSSKGSTSETPGQQRSTQGTVETSAAPKDSKLISTSPEKRVATLHHRDVSPFPQAFESAKLPKDSETQTNAMGEPDVREEAATTTIASSTGSSNFDSCDLKRDILPLVSDGESNSILRKNRKRVMQIGRKHLIDRLAQKHPAKLENRSKGDDDTALTDDTTGYSGRSEMVESLKSLDPREVDQDSLPHEKMLNVTGAKIQEITRMEPMAERQHLPKPRVLHSKSTSGETSPLKKQQGIFELHGEQVSHTHQTAFKDHGRVVLPQDIDSRTNVAASMSSSRLRNELLQIDELMGARSSRNVPDDESHMSGTAYAAKDSMQHSSAPDTDASDCFSLLSDPQSTSMMSAVESTLSAASSLAGRAEKALQKRRRQKGGNGQASEDALRAHDLLTSKVLSRPQHGKNQNVGSECSGENGRRDLSMKQGKARLSTRYTTSSRFIDSDGQSTSVGTRRMVSEGASVEQSVLPSASSESLESSCLSLETGTTGSDSRYYAGNAKPQKEKRLQGNLFDQVEERSKPLNFHSRRSACENVSIKEIASDWVGDVSAASFDINRLATDVNEKVSALRRFCERQKTFKPGLKLPKREDLVASPVEDVAIEVEYLDDSVDEDNPDSDLHTAMECSGEVPPAGEPSFERQPPVKHQEGEKPLMDV